MLRRRQTRQTTTRPTPTPPHPRGTRRTLTVSDHQADQLRAILATELMDLDTQMADEGDVEFAARLRQARKAVLAIRRQLEVR